MQQGGERVPAEAGVGIGAEEIAVIHEGMRADIQAVVTEPEQCGDSAGDSARTQQRTHAEAAGSEQRPTDGREQEDGGGLGKHRQRQQHAEGDGPAQGANAAGLAEQGGAAGMGRGQRGQSGTQHQQRLQDGKPGEDETERTDRQQQHGECGRKALAAAAHTRRTPELHQAIADEQGKAEDRDAEEAGCRQADAGDAKENKLQHRPHGQGRGGVEVSGNVPVSEQVMADGGIAVPALIGVLGPVHPLGVVGEVRAQVDIMQREEEARHHQQCADKCSAGSGIGLRDSGHRGLRRAACKRPSFDDSLFECLWHS